MAPTGKDDPRVVLSRAAWWLRGVGAVVATAGVVALVKSLTAAPEQDAPSSHFWQILRAVGAVAGWLIPGLLLITFSIFIARRKRWAITGAEVVTYIQMFCAGALIVFSLLHVKGLWPVQGIGLGWIIPLLFTHRFTEPCSRAMDLLAQLVTLGVDPPATPIRKERHH